MDKLMTVDDPASTIFPPGSRRLGVRAPGRLHLGFLDPSASLGRAWGSLGLTIETVDTEVLLGAAPVDAVTAADETAQAEIERASAHLAQLRERTGAREPLRLHLQQLPPAHAGFGSGTQLALAVGRAFAAWHGLDISSLQLARWLARGLRSGVGIAGFDQGGLLLDGGPGADGSPAPLLSRLDWPQDWRVVLVLDPRHRGLSGTAEKRALVDLPPLPRAAAADICHQVLMRVLAGAAGADFAAFAAGLSHMQRVLGDHFAAAQGGSAFTSAAVGRAVEWIGAQTGAAIGQSSWGPTGFAVLPTQAAAEAAVESARAAEVLDRTLVTRIVRGRNRGALVNEPSPGAPAPESP